MKKILMLILCTILLTATAFGLNFDNIKSYDSAEKKVTVKNAFGLGEKVAEIKLESPLVYNVRSGEDVLVAWYELKNYKDVDYGSAFEKIKTLDVKTENVLNKQITLKIKTKNGWEEIDSKQKLKKGTYVVGLFTDVEKDEIVEWIPDMFGITIEEWAVWRSTLNDGLIAWYDLNETSGTVVTDIEHGTHNGTSINTPTQGSEGIINNAYTFTRTNSEYINLSQNYQDFNFSSGAENGNRGNFTVSAWIYKVGTTAFYGIVDQSASSAAVWEFVANATNNLKGVVYEVGGGGTTVNTKGIITLNSWEHVVLSTNGTHIRIFLNGELIGNVSYGGTIQSWAYPPTIGNQMQGGGSNYFNGRIDEVGIWNRSLTASEISDLYNAGAGINPDSAVVTTILNSPSNNSFLFNGTEIFNASLDTNNNLLNATLMVWLANGTVYNQTNISISGTSNESIFNVTWLTPKNYLWNVVGCDSVSCQVAPDNFTFVYGVGGVNSSMVSPIFETQSASYNITFNVSSGTPSANLWLNGTKYAGTGTNIAGNQWRFDNTIQTSIGAGLKNIFWQIINGGAYFNTTAEQQNISLTNFTFCGQSVTVNPFINFTYKNETTAQELTTAFVTSSTWSFWLGDGSINKSSAYSTTTESANHSFCGTPPDKTFNVDVYYAYDNTESQQRTYSPSTLSLTNETTAQILWMLPTSQGIFVTFQVLNLAQQPISGAVVSVSRSGYGTITQESTGASGTVSIFLNPNIQYTLTVSKTGFSTFSTTQTFPTTEFTVTLGGTGGVASNDYTQGITFQLRPNVEVLTNQTDYEFNMTLNSSFWTVTQFGFTLSNFSGFELGTASTTTVPGIASTTINTGNQSAVVMTYYWIVNSTRNEGAVIWPVHNAQRGINRLINDFKDYLITNPFGLKNFGVSIILFTFVFFTVGFLTFKYGQISPFAIIAVICFLVILFDSYFGLFPPVEVIPGKEVSYMPSLFATITFLTALIWEVSK